jgi:phospholipase C
VNNRQRRDFLRQSLGTAGALAALGLLPPAIRRALAVEASVDTGTIADVKHVVILMQENRSFDHYFGTLRGVRGFGDRFPIPLESGQTVWYQSDGQRIIPPYHLDQATSNAMLVPGTPHTYSDSQAAWNQGKYGEWPRYKTQYSMGYYTRDDIPFQFALAEAFTLCDSYHCSVTGGTDPNRIMFFSGSNFDPALGQSGVNCTAQDSEPNNLRCSVSGTLPDPGYSYQGSAFKWSTLPDLLQQAGVSWRIYQDPNDNWDGLMHGGLAFASFRNAPQGSPLYVNGMTHWSLDDLRSDVLNGTLPAVSWVLPSKLQSEHPNAGSSPERGANFVTTVLEAVTADPGSWSQTVCLLMFDENDGFFDHIPPPAVPSYNADGTLAGASTVALSGEYFSDPARAYLEPDDTISGTVRPWGLGARVPMYVVSPWSKGGWVNSQVFDHTSVGQFLERRFGIAIDSISPWHRAVCGDLTSAFDFVTPNDPQWPALPDTSNYAALEAEQSTLPPANAPSTPQPLFQETGTRYSRALPYELHTSARIETAGALSLLLANSGTQGAVLHVYDKMHLERIPRRYTIESGKTLSGSWDTTADEGQYDLWVYGANGFVRVFQGNAMQQPSARFQPEIQVCYQRSSGKIFLKIHNAGAGDGMVVVRSNAYDTKGPWSIAVPGRDTATVHWLLENSGYWYDFSVEAANFQRRFAGRLETGKDSTSDPAMAIGPTA